MSLKKAALGFFKNNKISYLLEKDKIRFACFGCGKIAYMNIDSCFWNCCNCETNGSLVDLIKSEKNRELEEVPIINPQKIKNRINYELRELINKNELPQINNNLKKIYELLQVYISEIERS